MSDLISRQDIKYHTQLEAMGNGQYEEVEVAYKNDIESLPSADAVQIPIKLEKRYPQSRDEDITDAFMRGYLAGRSSADRPTGECKDCTHWEKLDYEAPRQGWCYQFEEFTDADEYCSRCAMMRYEDEDESGEDGEA